MFKSLLGSRTSLFHPLATLGRIFEEHWKRITKDGRLLYNYEKEERLAIRKISINLYLL